MVSEQIPEGIAAVMREVVGLDDPNPDDPLHREIWRAIADVGPGATYGQRIVAIRWVFNWALRDAGTRFATAKAEYERHLDRVKLKLFADDPKLSVAKAEIMANAGDEAYRLKLEYLLAEQEERAMRKFLDTLAAALDNHRTDRADMRGGDRASAQGYGGGA
jgi:hypothetical protein